MWRRFAQGRGERECGGRYMGLRWRISAGEKHSQQLINLCCLIRVGVGRLISVVRLAYFISPANQYVTTMIPKDRRHYDSHFHNM